ncbi:histidine-containing phosphotransfer protein 4-like [Senna tora]|uniref:Histidine-containing phosphotransfer protein 4-like n=1 Tax=Senna tora TaxID=362788 RepID=A0A834TF19_9FABA|nr:histidine-containing phosphotransfer protein 4-like [Senna tora]
MERQRLHQEIDKIKESLFDEGVLCREQFGELERLQEDKRRPHFLQQLFAVFFTHTNRHFNDLHTNLTKAAYEKVKQEFENLKLKVEPYFQDHPRVLSVPWEELN